MRGEYQYPPIKFMITRLTEEVNPQTKTTELQQKFLDGDYQEAATITIAFKQGLKRGDYLILY